MDLTGMLDGVATDVDASKNEELKAIEVPEGVITEPFFFDLETVPDYSRWHLFGFDPLPEVKRPRSPKVTHEEILSGSISDIKTKLASINPPEKWIDALVKTEESREKPRAGVKDAIKSMRKDRQSKIDAKAAREKKMSVTPEFCRICAFGFALGDDEPQSVFVDDDESERELLRLFWKFVKNLRAPLVGYNIIHFDLPVIYVRSIILGVRPSRNFDVKPWGSDVYDLMKKRFPSGGQMGMKDIARIYNLDVPAGECEGSQVLELFNKGDKNSLLEYVESDVSVSYQLYSIWKPFF